MFRNTPCYRGSAIRGHSNILDHRRVSTQTSAGSVALARLLRSDGDDPAARSRGNRSVFDDERPCGGLEASIAKQRQEPILRLACEQASSNRDEAIDHFSGPWNLVVPLWLRPVIDLVR